MACGDVMERTALYGEVNLPFSQLCGRLKWCITVSGELQRLLARGAERGDVHCRIIMIQPQTLKWQKQYN